MKLETKIEYLNKVHMLIRVLYWLGCMRFGEEKLRMSRYQERTMEVGLYFRFWHPLMVIAAFLFGIYELVHRLLVTVKEFAQETIDEIKDDTPCGYTLYRRLEKKKHNR